MGRLAVVAIARSAAALLRSSPAELDSSLLGQSDGSMLSPIVPHLCNTLEEFIVILDSNIVGGKLQIRQVSCPMSQSYHMLRRDLNPRLSGLKLGQPTPVFLLGRCCH